MTIENDSLTAADYGVVLGDYLHDRSEKSLLRASDLSRIFVESGLGPEDVVALHFESLKKILPRLTYREQARAFGDAHQFLLETMIAYGVRYKDYLEMKLQQAVTDAEARASREREKVMEAERSERASRDVLEHIAHELRTPITAAKSSLDLATRFMTQGRIEPASQFVGTARDAIDRLTRLTGDLVEASHGRVSDIVMGPTDLRAVVQQAISWAQPAATNKGVSLSFDGGQTEIGLMGNADALLSVFGNLMSNAIRYTEPGGKIDVRIATKDNVAHVEVVDNGIGMSPDVVVRIFEKFYRAPAARKIEAQGLGLGLSLVEQMVAAHSGRVEVDSEMGRGSTFRVILPRGLPAASTS